MTRGMMTSLAWVAVALLAGAFIAVRLVGPGAIDDRAQDHDGHDEAAQLTLLWPEGPAALAALELIGPNGRTRYERDPAGDWFAHASGPDAPPGHRHQALADESVRLRAAIDTFARTRLERRIVPIDRAAFGLERPVLIALLFDAGGRHVRTVEFGGGAPDGLSRYVLVAQLGAIYTIPGYQADGLAALAAPGRK